MLCFLTFATETKRQVTDHGDKATMNRRFHIYIIIFFIHFFCIHFSEAQRLPFFNHYYDNPYLYNPAYAGYDKHSVFYLTHRQQWFGVEGAPVSTQLSFHSPLGNANPLFIGGDISNDQLGALNHTSVKFTAAYMIPLSAENEHYIKTAFSAGVGMHSYDFGSMDIGDDAVLQAALANHTFLDGRFGLRYHNQGFNLSASLPHLFTPPSVLADGFSEPSIDQFSRMIFSAHYRFKFSPEGGLSFEPTVLYHYNREGVSQMEGMGTFYYRSKESKNEQKDIFWFGGSYQQQSGFGGMAGFRVNNLKFSYAYSMGGSEVASYGIGSHEIQLGFIIGKKKVMLKRKPRLRTASNSEEVPDEALMKKHEKSRKKNKKKDKKKEKVPDRKRVTPPAQQNNPSTNTEQKKESQNASQATENQFIVVGETTTKDSQTKEADKAETKKSLLENQVNEQTAKDQSRAVTPQNMPKKEKDYSKLDFDSFESDKKGVIKLGDGKTKKTPDQTRAQKPKQVEPEQKTQSQEAKPQTEQQEEGWGNSPWSESEKENQAESAHPLAMNFGFYVIAGSFSTEANANKLAKRLKAQGFDAAVGYHTEKQYYYVHVAKAEMKSQALQALELLRQYDQFSSAWILNVNP